MIYENLKNSKTIKEYVVYFGLHGKKANYVGITKQKMIQANLTR